jgi:hypothetical protein
MMMSRAVVAKCHLASKNYSKNKRKPQPKKMKKNLQRTKKNPQKIKKKAHSTKKEEEIKKINPTQMKVIGKKT